MKKLAVVCNDSFDQFIVCVAHDCISSVVLFNFKIVLAGIGLAEKYHGILLDAVIIMALIIAILIIILFALIKRTKRNKENNAETYSTVILTKPIDDSQTMTVYGGETEVLFEDNKKFEIVLVDRSNSEIRYGIIGDEAIIGRNKVLSDITIEKEKSISQKHCKIFIRGSSVYISDLESLNHTYVDGEIINDETEIVSGSEIKIGRKVFKVEITAI